MEGGGRGGLRCVVCFFLCGGGGGREVEGGPPPWVRGRGGRGRGAFRGGRRALRPELLQHLHEPHVSLPVVLRMCACLECPKGTRRCCIELQATSVAVVRSVSQATFEVQTQCDHTSAIRQHLPLRVQNQKYEGGSVPLQRLEHVVRGERQAFLGHAALRVHPELIRALCAQVFGLAALHCLIHRLAEILRQGVRVRVLFLAASERCIATGAPPVLQPVLQALGISNGFRGKTLRLNQVRAEFLPCRTRQLGKSHCRFHLRRGPCRSWCVHSAGRHLFGHVVQKRQRAM